MKKTSHDELISNKPRQNFINNFMLLLSVLTLQSIGIGVITYKLSFDVMPWLALGSLYMFINFLVVCAYTLINKVFNIYASSAYTIVFGLFMSAAILIEHLLYYMRIIHITSNLIYLIYAFIIIGHILITKITNKGEKNEILNNINFDF